MMDYRTKIYKKYASKIKNYNQKFNQKEADCAIKSYRYYLRDWLPEDKNASILDLGCGNGKILYFFKNRGYKVIQGVDVSPEQAAISRQLHAEVYEKDAVVFLRENRESFRLIIALDIIEHLRKEEVLEFLEACSDSLQQGGRLVIQTPNAQNPFSLAIRYGDFTHETMFTPQSLSSLLSLTGFSNICAREAGPVAHGFISLIRYCLWKIIKTAIIFGNLVETGSKGDGINTRVFLVSGIKNFTEKAL